MKFMTARLLNFLILFTLAMPAIAQNYPGVPAKTGHVTFKFGSRDLSYNQVEGGFQNMSGFTMATLVFKPDLKSRENTHLNITLMYQAPGRVDLETPFSLSGIGMWWKGDVSAYTKGKGKCTITLTKATATDVEGTADCPTLHDMEGKVSEPLTNVKFSATTK